MSVQFRDMTLADIDAGLALCRASGWNQTAADWRTFLTTAPQGAIVAVEGTRVVGSAATLPYGSFTWVSMVLVEPAARGRGVGSALLARILTRVPADSIARLDATPLGEPIYRKLGFEPEQGLARWSCARPVLQPASGPVRRLASSDWPAIASLDADVFGASRVRLLERLAAEAPDLAWVSEERGRLRGFVLGRPGHVRDHIGPLVADTSETARPLFEAALAGVSARGALIDVPDRQTRWRPTLEARGFTIERPFLRMARGSRATPGDPSRVFAATGPEFG